MAATARALFHIGLHKTGTTSFQRAAIPGARRTEPAGIIYPAPPTGGSSDQHADLPAMLTQGRIGEVTAYFRSTIAAANAAGGNFGPPVCLLVREFSNLVYDEMPSPPLRRSLPNVLMRSISSF